MQPGAKQWLEVATTPVGDRPDPSLVGHNVFVVVKRNPGIWLWRSDELVPGVAYFRRRAPVRDEAWTEQFREWKATDPRDGVVFRLPQPTRALSADRLTGGYARPYGGPQLWSSADLIVDPSPTVELEWETAVRIGEIQLVLDDDLGVDLINLHHHETPQEIMPTLLRDYDLEMRQHGQWRTLAEVRDNRRRHLRHRLSAPTAVEALRVRVLATNGAPHAHIVKVRAYAAERAAAGPGNSRPDAERHGRISPQSPATAGR